MINRRYFFHVKYAHNNIGEYSWFYEEVSFRSWRTVEARTMFNTVVSESIRVISRHLDVEEINYNDIEITSITRIN